MHRTWNRYNWGMRRHSYPFDCSVTELAKRLKIQRSFLNRVLAQGSKNERVCLAIEQETRGAVRAVDLIALKMRRNLQNQKK